ncbi:hypothetical protein Tco_0529680 [Tanacetum coccineum]
MQRFRGLNLLESSYTDTPLETGTQPCENDVFAQCENDLSGANESINETYVLEKDDSMSFSSSNICTNDNQVDQNATECVDERAALANLIANLTLDNEENKTFLKQLKKANASLTQELKECKTNLDESSRALGEATSSRDSSLIALQTKQTELEKYTALNDLTSEYKILQSKLNETLGLLARKDIDIKEGLKTKTYEISVVNQKHDELVKKSLLNKSQFEGQLKEKTKVISDLKVKEGKDIDTMIEMDKQIKFLNEILYKRNQSIQDHTSVIHTTSVSRPQLKSYQVKEKVVPNISQVKFTKKVVEDHHRISSISKKTKSVTACRTVQTQGTSKCKCVCAECGNLTQREKRTKSVATPHKKTVASDTTIQKSKSYYKKLYEDTNQEWKWWIAKRCPSGYTWTQKPLRTKKIWMPKIRKDDIVQLILFIVDSGCTKHMMGNLKLLCNFMEKFLGTVRFGNDQFAPILDYGDLKQGNVTIKRVYYIEGLNHNLFSVGQLCDANLEVAFRKSTCFVRDLQGNDLHKTATSRKELELLFNVQP